MCNKSSCKYYGEDRALSKARNSALTYFLLLSLLVQESSKFPHDLMHLKFTGREKELSCRDCSDFFIISDLWMIFQFLNVNNYVSPWKWMDNKIKYYFLMRKKKKTGWDFKKVLSGRYQAWKIPIYTWPLNRVSEQAKIKKQKNQVLLLVQPSLAEISFDGGDNIHCEKNTWWHPG